MPRVLAPRELATVRLLRPHVRVGIGGCCHPLPGRLVDEALLGEGVDAGDSRTEGHVDKELHDLRFHHGPPDAEVNDSDVGLAGTMADGNRYGRADIADRALQCLGPPVSVGRDPDHVLRLLRPFAKGGAEAVGALTGHVTVVNVDELGPRRILQCRWAEVGVCELVRLEAGPEPHLGDVEPHDFARRRQDGLDGRRGLVEQPVLVQ